MDGLVDDAEIRVVLVCLRTGALLSDPDSAPTGERYGQLAEAAPELFAASANVDFGPIFARLGSECHGDSFQELVFVSQTCAHVVQRLRARPDMAVIAVSRANEQVGLMLSFVRARVVQLEAEYEG